MDTGPDYGRVCRMDHTEDAGSWTIGKVEKDHMDDFYGGISRTAGTGTGRIRAVPDDRKTSSSYPADDPQRSCFQGQHRFHAHTFPEHTTGFGACLVQPALLFRSGGQPFCRPENRHETHQE